MSEKVMPQDIFEGYGGRKERLYSYATLVGVFNLVFAVFLLLAKSLGRSIPDQMDLKDLVLLRMRLQAPCAPRSPSFRRRKVRRVSKRSHEEKDYEGLSASW